MAAGKSRQAARGHKLREHVIRREREIRQRGLSSAQERSIRNFHRRFDPNGTKKTPSADDMIAYAKEHGFNAFAIYRHNWNILRKRYVQAQKRGTYKPRPFNRANATGRSEGASGGGFGNPSFGEEDDYLEDLFEFDLDDDDYEMPDWSWFFYH